MRDITKHLICILVIYTCALSSCTSSQAIDSPPRQVIPFNLDWKFALGDYPKAINVNYDDMDWRALNLPHDWSIEGEYDSLNPAGIAGAFLPTGIGWYRKTFEYDPRWEGREVIVAFDGVYLNSTVWINGEQLGTRPNGYIGFEYNLSDYLVEGKNVMVVKVDHSKSPTGRWYTGSGIYRHVNLVVRNKTHVPSGGLFVTTPNIKSDEAQVAINLEIDNPLLLPSLEVVYEILSPDGEIVKRVSSKVVSSQSNITTEINISIPSPKLWSVAEPNLYVAKVSVSSKDELLDNISTNFGIRDVVASKEGLFINGKKTILKGICMHHDAGPVGTAVPEDVLYSRLKTLKEMGCNAIRTSHNPFAPEFYNMCDSMGFLVMDEAFDGWEEEKAEYDYGLYFEDWWQRDLTSFIKRDRNHPSVVFWSIGNEVKGYSNETQQTLVDFVKTLDTTRYISQGRGYWGPAIDLAGFNGHGELKNGLDHFHEKNSEKPIIGTEITHTYQTRGIYRTKTWYRRRDFPAPWEIGQDFNKMKDKVYLVDDLTSEEVFKNINPIYQSSYDNSLVRMNVRDYWKSTKDKSYFLGAFRWTGFDYLGESFGWPARTMSFGIMDLAGLRTDHFYLYQSLWSNEPMVHLLPHWTHLGKEGVVIPVVVYTNCKEAELFLNDVSLGKKRMTEDLQIVWDVPYAPGDLRVEAVASNGRRLKKTYYTAQEPAGIRTRLNKKSMRANNRDVVIAEVSVVDANGIEVPNADNLLTFDLEGPGEIIGVENGDILDLTPAKEQSRKAFMGKCVVLIQSGGEAGELLLTVKSGGLISERVTININ